MSYPIKFATDVLSACKDSVFGLDEGEVPEYQQKITGTSAKNVSPYGNISSANYYYNNVSPTGTFSAKPDRKANKQSNTGRSSERRDSRKDSRNDSRK